MYAYVPINCETVELFIATKNQRSLNHLLVEDWLDKVCSFNGFLCSPYSEIALSVMVWKECQNILITKIKISRIVHKLCYHCMLICLYIHKIQMERRRKKNTTVAASTEGNW